MSSDPEKTPTFPPKRRPRGEYDRYPNGSPMWHELDRIWTDDLIEGLEEYLEKCRQELDAAAIRARVLEPGRYPRLHLAGGKRAGLVGEARFKGRYHPHLIVDNTKREL